MRWKAVAVSETEAEALEEMSVSPADELEEIYAGAQTSDRAASYLD